MRGGDRRRLGRARQHRARMARLVCQGWRGDPQAPSATGPAEPDRHGTAAAALAEAVLAEDINHDRGWTLPRLRVEIERRGGPAISDGWLSIPLRQRGSAGAGHGIR